MVETIQPKKLVLLLFGLLLSILGNCAPSHTGRTVGKGVLQVEGSLGGPFFKNLGPTIPIPNLPIGARYGLTDRIDLSAHANVLSFVMGGFLTLDTGATWGLYQHQGKKGFNLAMSTNLFLLTDFQEDARVGPLLDMAGGYTYDWLTTFGGFEMIIDFYKPNAITNSFIGVEFDIKKASLSLSGIYFHPAFNAYASSVKYVSPGDRGAIGILLGFKYRFDIMSSNKEKADEKS